MKSKLRGKSTSRRSSAAVAGVSRLGLWLNVEGREYFLPFRRFPWFRRAPLDGVFKVKCRRGKYLHWPELDVDLELECLTEPDRYPLIYS